MDDIVPMARLCNYLSSLSMYTFRIYITFVAASKCEAYHRSVACFPNVAEISSKLSHIFLSASQSAARKL